MKLFAGHMSAHGTHGEPTLSANGLKWEIKSTAKTKREPPTIELWEKHLNGDYPLGIIPIQENNHCVWGSIDIDLYDVDLLEIIRKVESAHLPLVPCRSKSGGLHLFLFLKEPQSAEVVQRVLHDVAARLGLSGSEIFPKQTHINTNPERPSFGNWMVMPYFGGTFDGKLKLQVGLKKTGAEQTISEFLSFCEDKQLTLPQLMELGARPRQQRQGNGVGEFSDGPCCLENLCASGFPEGGRNNALFMAGIYFKKKNPMEWKDKVREYNQRFMRPPLTVEELEPTLHSLERREYEYTCRVEPMVSHCDSATCGGRRHGVGNGNNFPNITDIEKFNSDPVMYAATINGRVIDLTTEQLLNYTQFVKVALDKVNLGFSYLSQKAWINNVLLEPMNRMRVTDVSEDLTRKGQFVEILEDFLTDSNRGRIKSDLIRGRPWEDEEAQKHYFRSKDLEKFLTSRNQKNISRPDIQKQIVELGGGNHQFTIDGKCVRCWWVPSSVIGPPAAEPTPRNVRSSPI